jgi:hypothetical protein
MHYAPGCVHRRNRMLDRSCTTRQLAHNPQSVTRDPSCARRLGRPMSPEPRGKAASAHAHDVDPALLLLEVGSGVRYGRVAAPGSRPRPGSANVPSRHDAAAPPPLRRVGLGILRDVAGGARESFPPLQNSTFKFRNSKNSTSFEKKL